MPDNATNNIGNNPYEKTPTQKMIAYLKDCIVKNLDNMLNPTIDFGVP